MFIVEKAFDVIRVRTYGCVPKAVFFIFDNKPWPILPKFLNFFFKIWKWRLTGAWRGRSSCPSSGTRDSRGSFSPSPPIFLQGTNQPPPGWRTDGPPIIPHFRGEREERPESVPNYLAVICNVNYKQTLEQFCQFGKRSRPKMSLLKEWFMIGFFLFFIFLDYFFRALSLRLELSIYRLLIPLQGEPTLEYKVVMIRNYREDMRRVPGVEPALTSFATGDRERSLLPGQDLLPLFANRVSCWTFP